jgi:predicted enzyme related to lactoylglutathione lyase
MNVGSAFVAVHMAADQLEQSVAFYERLFDQRCSLRFVWTEHEVEIAAVGPVVMIAGSPTALGRSVSQAAALSVESLADSHEALIGIGATIVQQPGETPTGRNLFARHPDGAVFEYIQFDSAKASAVNLA